MAKIKTEKEIAIMREGGRRLASIFESVAQKTKAGVSAKELDDFAREQIIAGGDIPAFLNYRPEGAIMPFPATLCVSVNDEMVHGLPLKEKIFKDGDIVALDLGLIHQGLVSDMNMTVGIGNVDENGKKLIEAAHQSLMIGIKAALPGKHVGDIGFAVENFVKAQGFNVSYELGGHGVGRKVHEDPYIPHFGNKGQGIKIVPGMVFTIEPTITEGHSEMYLAKDGFTYKTIDGKRSAQFEHTILITKEGNDILTRI